MTEQAHIDEEQLRQVARARFIGVMSAQVAAWNDHVHGCRGCGERMLELVLRAVGREGERARQAEPESCHLTPADVRALDSACLPSAVRRRLERHVESCQACRAEVNQPRVRRAFH